MFSGYFNSKATVCAWIKEVVAKVQGLDSRLPQLSIWFSMMVIRSFSAYLPQLRDPSVDH
jgi:hypothetical protein